MMQLILNIVRDLCLSLAFFLDVFHGLFWSKLLFTLLLDLPFLGHMFCFGL